MNARIEWLRLGRLRAHGLLALILGVAAIVALAWVHPFRAGVADEGNTKAAQAAKPADAVKQPVILLTGFEPFGPGRPPNPSWEAVKTLDGQEWRGYRLVGKELSVVWGAPLEQLQALVAEYEPVAVFSFGQGGPGFTIESRAVNSRGGGYDNNSQPPPRPTIVADGPGEFQSTIEADRMARALAGKGYPIRVSNNAGRYLCEECLYSLEYLKAAKQVKGTVQFSHVPPLGMNLHGQPVTVAYVRDYVKDVLEAWYTLSQERPAAGPATETGNAEDSAARQREVKQFVEGYFRSWSNQDMKAYSDCFLPAACVQLMDDQGHVTSYLRDGFVATQRDHLRRANPKPVEVPETIEIRFEAKLARAVVYWKLTAGSSTVFGYDHFTLAKQRQGWKIANLIFYSTTPD